MKGKSARSSVLVFWVMLIVGIAVGGLLSYIGAKVGGPIWWLSFGKIFSIGSPASPFLLDLNVIKFTFALVFKLDIGTVIGIVAGLFAWKYVF